MDKRVTIGTTVGYVTGPYPVESTDPLETMNFRYPAMVTSVSTYADGSVASVSLCVFKRSGFKLLDTVHYDEKHGPRTWHWLED